MSEGIQLLREYYHFRQLDFLKICTEYDGKEKGSDDVLAGIDRTDLYKSFVLEHVVPRFNNPSGVFDNDRYLYEIFVKDGDTTLITKIETLFTQIATVADVPFENGAGTGIDPIA